jgi:hypothetical protein
VRDERDVLPSALDRYTWLEARDDLIHCVGPVAGERHRSPKIHLMGKLQACGHHAPHGKALSIQSDRLSHNVWVGVK